MKTLHALEVVILLPLALLHVLVDRLLAPPPVVVLEQALAPAPLAVAPPPLTTLTVHELRRLAQARGLRVVGGVRTSKARRADLVAALG